MKKYSKPNLVKAVSVGVAITALLSSVSPIFAANLAILGQTVKSTNGPGVLYKNGSHGSVVLIGDDDFCGVDNVKGRGGEIQKNIADSQRITVEEQYLRFLKGYNAPGGGNPYGTHSEQITWVSEGRLSGNNSYMGKSSTDGTANAMPEAFGVYSFATGCGSSATGNYSTAFGAGATAKAAGAQAFGVSALAGGTVSVALGMGSEAGGEASVAVGGLATASGSNSIAVGAEAKAAKNYSIAIGLDSEAKGSGSIAIGSRLSDRTEAGNPERKVIAEGENSVAIGTHTYGKGEDSVAIGANAQALVRDGVAVGGASVSRVEKGIKGYDPATGQETTKIDVAWKSTAGAFSVGDVGASEGKITRQITGVAAGTEDTDAVNVAQLKAISAAASGAWKLSVNDENSTDVNPGSTIDFSVEDAKVGKDNLTIKRETQQNKHKIKFALNDNLKLTSVTTGRSTMSDDGFIINNGPRMSIDGFMVGDENAPSMTVEGINAGKKKIINVADATDDYDAVNYKQLKDIKDSVTTRWQLTVNGQNATSIGQNETVNFQADNKKGNQNIKIVGDDKRNVTFDLAEDITVTSVTTGNSIMSNQGFGFINGGPKISMDGINAGSKNIINVADGTRPNDAVNYKQLKNLQEIVLTQGWYLLVNGENESKIVNGSTVDLVADQNEEPNIIIKKNDDKVEFSLNKRIEVETVLTKGAFMNEIGLGVTDGASITTQGIDAGNKIITGVLKGEKGTDAVNVAQLNEMKVQIADNSLVKWDDGKKLITIGAQKEGIEINITNSKGESRIIDGVRDGKVSYDSKEAINGSQFFNYADNVSEYFGGETDVINGFKPTFTVQHTTHNNVTDAFADVDTFITDIYQQITNVTNNSLVKWDEDTKRITIGEEKGGTKIDITGTSGERTIAGVKGGKISEDSTEAINGSQINKISGNIAEFFGGDAAFQDGAFVGPTYNLSKVSTDGTVKQDTFKNVGDALTGLDANVKNVNSRLTHVTNEFNQKFDNFSQDALLWSENERAFVALHGPKGGKTDSKITYLLDGEIAPDSSDAVNGSQIYFMGSKLAEYFGGGASFKDGTLTPPKYSLPIIFEDGTIGKVDHHDVGSALESLNGNVTNVNNRLTNVANEFTKKFDVLSQDALLWDEEEQAFVALHGKDGNQTKSKISYLKDGEIHKESTDAVNGSQIYSISSKIASHFGGGAGYNNNGEWNSPTFHVYHINDDGTVSEKPYDNVADAFGGVNNSFAQIHNQISNITENSLVKQEGESGLITIGKATGGTKISITNKNDQERTLAGVKDGELSQTSTEAVNGSQLFKTNGNVKTVTDNLSKAVQNISKYFGGGTDVLAGIEPTFLIQGKPYHNVTDAFSSVNTSITNIDNKITEMKENSLVQQKSISDIITIGAKTAGTEMNIAGYGNVARSISGVKAAEKGDEAVNKDQLDESIERISNDVRIASAAAVLYDKNEDGTVNYDSVTLGGERGAKPVALLNVKDGKISQDSHDAVNGSQINKISGDIANYFGGNASFKDGTFKGPKYTLSTIVEDGQVAKVNYYNVGDALTGLDANVKSVNNRLTNVANNFNQKIEGISKDALLWDDEEQAFVARHEKDGQKTNSKLKYLLDGDISKGSTDAITGNQLFLMSNQLAAYFGGGAKYENGKWTAPNFKIVQVNADGTTVEKSHNNVAEAFDGINNGMSNINNRIDDVINKVDSDALKWNKQKGAYDAGRNGQPSKIINVADGKIEKGSKDAVNGGQLWETNERITGVEKDVKHISNRVDNISNTIADIGNTVLNIDAKVDNIENKVNDIAEDAVRYDRDENGKKTNKITLKGSDASEPVLIDNVADGRIEKGSKEAVNGGQLHDYTKEQMKLVLDESKHYTDRRVNNIVVDAIDDAVERANNYTNMKFDALNYSIENVRKEASQAAAIGLAVSNLRYNDTPGKLSVGFGSGLWRSQSAFAFGAGYTSEKGNIRSNVSVTTSGGHWGVGAGFNMTLN
ncbi:Vomp family autotransporter [Bartonella phoceensis]|uniref:Vomp family autotransporter n=1 Tax=Bartonella phoceensis TaxID=270249 RepID=UPI001ABB1372|nr:Vomp family autotransporter [Bartonella phoceensis]